MVTRVTNIIGFEDSKIGLSAIKHVTPNVYTIRRDSDYLKIMEYIKIECRKKYGMHQINSNLTTRRKLGAVEDCLRDGWLAGFGERTAKFEERVSELFGKKHGLFVNSGSSAILLGLHALDLPKGSEIVTPACGFATTVAPIIQLGMKPVFCDVELTTYVPSVKQLKEVVTPETKCLLLPNLIGNVPDWEAIREAFPNLILFEDSADTITRTDCTDLSTTSFYASHVITAGGIGGMLWLCLTTKRISKGLLCTGIGGV